MAGSKLKGVKTMQVETVKGVDKPESHDTIDAAKALGRVKSERKPAKHYISHHHGHGKVSGKIVVKKGKDVQYVERLVGIAMVQTDGYEYGKKAEWKKLVRDV